jgi:hypothetical protein
MQTFNPLKPKLIQIIFKHLVCTAKKTPHFLITKISCLMLLREIIAVYTENHTKSINILCDQYSELLTVKAGGTYSYRYLHI